LLAHLRHDGARHPHEPEEIGVEDRTRLLHRAFFRAGGRNPEAGVVDQQVDAALALHQLLDRGVHRVVAVHVQGQHLEGPSAARGTAAAAGAVDLVARLRKPFRRGQADAR
jgi:hypothetical protein